MIVISVVPTVPVEVTVKVFEVLVIRAFAQVESSSTPHLANTSSEKALGEF